MKTNLMGATTPKAKKMTVTALVASPPVKEYVEPTPAERIVDSAHYEKRNATERWIRGDISNEEHTEIHKRANRVIAAPRSFVSGKIVGGGKKKTEKKVQGEMVDKA